ncbi:MAG: hypothetical protein M3432_07860 [Chloroflexota bacterium]|nr:hypothetical protein [Chloroflexota bacterium]
MLTGCGVDEGLAEALGAAGALAKGVWVGGTSVGAREEVREGIAEAGRDGSIEAASVGADPDAPGDTTAAADASAALVGPRSLGDVTSTTVTVATTATKTMASAAAAQDPFVPAVPSFMGEATRHVGT